MVRLFTILFLFVTFTGFSQEYSTASVFSHNDYAGPSPLHVAYQYQVGYIEADVFLENGQLLVSHTRQELNREKTLEILYLKPLTVIIGKNGGSVYKDKSLHLTVMVDLKTDGLSTLRALVKLLDKYPQLKACNTLHFAVSGSVPKPEQWNEFPAHITFDGRPGVIYSTEQLRRVSMISDDFRKYSDWNGKGKMVKTDLNRVMKVRDQVHAYGKKLRFWSAPDASNAWATLMQLQIDIINTDHVPELAEFIVDRPNRTYTHPVPHDTYIPKGVAKGRVPKNVILLIGDGMGLTQLYSGFTANRGALNIFSINSIGLAITTSADAYITDSAAGATALATGVKTNNRFVGVDSLGRPLVPITVLLQAHGFQTAVISSGDITDATPASFYAHQPERSMSDEIAADLVNSKLDIAIGAGYRSFAARKDSVDLLKVLRRNGYSVSNRLNSLDTLQSRRFMVIDDEAGKRWSDGRGNFLVKAFEASTRVMKREGRPFFVMAEGAQIDWGGHANNLAYLTTELLDFDQLVGAALQLADHDGETLVIITADHETGGLSLIGGDIATGRVEANFGTVDHTGVLVPVFAHGPGADQFRGVYQNTEIYHKIRKLLVP